MAEVIGVVRYCRLQHNAVDAARDQHGANHNLVFDDQDRCRPGLGAELTTTGTNDIVLYQSKSAG